MRMVGLGFLIGVIACQSLADLPSKTFTFLLLVLIPAVFYFPKARFFTCIGIGFLYSLFIAHEKLADQFPAALEGVNLLVSGTIASLPRKSADVTSFQFKVSDFSEFNQSDTQDLQNVAQTNHIVTQSSPTGQKILLNAYKINLSPGVGETWQFVVRLKRPNGFSNPGGFDYERWLFQQNIVAKGYIVHKKKTVDYNHLLSQQRTPNYWSNSLRQNLRQRLNETMDDKPLAALIVALVIGDRQALTEEHWRVLTGTGTNHLMAISGLHIGLVAGLGFLIGSRLSRLLPRLLLYVPDVKAGALLAISFAVFYAALAGFSIPTQRALIMVMVVMIAVWCQRIQQPSRVLSFALILVLVFEPMSVLDMGFWLSFLAVAIILYGMSGRLITNNWWWKWGRVQWIIAVGLMPALLFSFNKVPIIAPLANLIAVPVVSIVTVPLSLLGGLSALWSPSLASLLLYFAHLSLELLWPLLAWFSSLRGLQLTSATSPAWALVLAAIGIIILLAPRGLPARWLGIFWLLPMLVIEPRQISEGSYELTLLDVGQGLSAVLKTKNHIMIYDTGPRFGKHFDAAKAVIIPYLKFQGIESIDTLVLSHDDMDHVGGAPALMAYAKIDNVVLAPGVKVNRQAVHCEKGLNWQWDGVKIEFLHPKLHSLDAADNNRSCVVRISSVFGRALITGDIEKTVESQLMTEYVSDANGSSNDSLSADILVVPHHGSLSSSSERFVHAVSPRYALSATGYRNRYELPKTQVVARYEAVGAEHLSTDLSGAVTVFVSGHDQISVIRHREQSRRYWSRHIP